MIIICPKSREDINNKIGIFNVFAYAHRRDSGGDGRFEVRLLNISSRNFLCHTPFKGRVSPCKAEHGTAILGTTITLKTAKFLEANSKRILDPYCHKQDVNISSQ